MSFGHWRQKGHVELLVFIIAAKLIAEFSYIAVIFSPKGFTLYYGVVFNNSKMTIGGESKRNYVALLIGEISLKRDIQVQPYVKTNVLVNLVNQCDKKRKN